MKLATLLVSAIAIAPIVAFSQSAQAEPAGFDGNYVGVSVNGNLFEDARNSLINPGNVGQRILQEALRQQGLIPDDRQEESGAAALGQHQYQGRVDLQNSALSLRGTVYLEDGARAILPTLSYDFAVGNDTNVYAGAGYALVDGEGGVTPVGDRSGLVLTAGAEAEALPGLVIYGDAKFGINTDSVRGNSPMRLQLGVGRRF